MAAVNILVLHKGAIQGQENGFPVSHNNGLYLSKGAVQLAEPANPGNAHKAWRGAVEPASVGASGNEYKASRGAVEPPLIEGPQFGSRGFAWPIPYFHPHN